MRGRARKNGICSQEEGWRWANKCSDWNEHKTRCRKVMVVMLLQVVIVVVVVTGGGVVMMAVVVVVVVAVLSCGVVGWGKEVAKRVAGIAA